MTWGEILSASEVDFCEVVRGELSAVDWARPLLDKLPATDDLTYADKPLLFELRFAGEIHRRGLRAEYEFPGEGASTIDFRLVEDGVEWLIELVSILTSDAVKSATQTDGPFFSTLLSTDASDQRQSEEGEILLVQQKIGEKVWQKDRPIKFPQIRPRRYHAILVDTRGFGIGGGDLLDYREIAYGPGGFTNEDAQFRHFWKLKDGSRSPIRGVFEPENQQRFTKTLQERVQFLGFCKDEKYRPGTLLEGVYFLPNPHLLTQPDADAAFGTYPLRHPPA